MNEQLRFRKDEQKVLGAGEYSVDHESASHTVYTGLYAGDKIIALLVASDEDATPENIDAIGERIVRACNAHKQLVDALKQISIISRPQMCMDGNAIVGSPNAVAYDFQMIASAALAATGAA
jgi:hypothetical protein